MAVCILLLCLLQSDHRENLFVLVHTNVSLLVTVTIYCLFNWRTLSEC